MEKFFWHLNGEGIYDAFFGELRRNGEVKVSCFLFPGNFERSFFKFVFRPVMKTFLSPMLLVLLVKFMSLRFLVSKLS